MSRSRSLTHLLQHCIKTRNLSATKILHTHLLRTGLLFTSLDLHTHLILSYATCLPNPNPNPNPNKNLFLQTTGVLLCYYPANPLSFNTLLSLFCRNGLPLLALHTLSLMHSNGVPLDSYSLCTCLKASSSSSRTNNIITIPFGKQIHTHVTKLGLLSSVYVASALIVLYSKSSLLIHDASKVFDEIPVKNIVCANSLLSGFQEAHMWPQCLRLLRLMRSSCLRLDYDRFTLSTILRVSASLTSIELGKQAHGNAVRTIPNMDGDMFLQTSLIDMYGKCGFVEKAHYVFGLLGVSVRGRAAEENKRKRDVILWTSMIGAYARNGRFQQVIGLFKDMLIQGVRPDGLVFLAVISACGYTGNVNMGLRYFESMIHDFGIQPDPEHYSCVVDMLCRAGELEKACELLVNEVPFEGSVVSMWGALLSAATNCGNVEMGKLAAQKALELDPQNVAIYVLLSNLYAKVGMWDEIGELRELIKDRGLTKDVGCSWIQVAC